MSVTLKELKSLKRKLEDDIYSFITVYEKETKTIVKSVDINREWTIGGEPILNRVSTIIEL